MKRRNKIAAALLFAASIPAVSTWAQNSLRSAYFPLRDTPTAIR